MGPAQRATYPVCFVNIERSAGLIDLCRLLRYYVRYYHGARTHRSLAKDAAEPRRVERRDEGRIVEKPMAGGLHHRYGRRAA